MGQILISNKTVKSNKMQKSVQKAYLKAHKAVKTKFPKAKLGKVVGNNNSDYFDCTEKSESAFIKNTNETADEIIADIKSKNIVGLSGSGFPTARKIESVMKSDARKKYFIVNAVGCDPGLLTDAYLLENFKDEIDRGIEIISRCTSFEKVIIATAETNVPPNYPMGAEQILIKHLLNIDMSADDIPSEKGILVLNVQTVLAVANGEKPESRYITVCDLDMAKAVVARVKIGQSIHDILKKCGFIKNGAQKYYCGMGAMDADEISGDYAITITDGFVAISERVASFDNSNKCKGCGKCVKNCPMGVKVKNILRAASKGRSNEFVKYGINNCIHCGTCTYYCVAEKSPMQALDELEN